jgi:hypothetical protein
VKGKEKIIKFSKPWRAKLQKGTSILLCEHFITEIDAAKALFDFKEVYNASCLLENEKLLHDPAYLAKREGNNIKKKTSQHKHDHNVL